MQPQRQTDEILDYPPLDDALQASGLETMDTYISRHQNTVAHYIAAQPILDLCLEEEQRPGVWVPKQWW